MDPLRELRLDDDAFADLSAQILRQGGSFRFRVGGSSMIPFVRDGDLLTIAPVDAADLRIGDVALYRTHLDRVVAHRVVGRAIRDGELVLETRGDARLVSDSPVPASRVLGRAVRLQRGDRVRRLDRGPWRLAARIWVWVHPLRCAAARLVRSVKGLALKVLQAIQSLPPYRRLARGWIGAGARYRPAEPGDAADLARLFGQESLPGIRGSAGSLVRRIVAGELDGLALMANVGDRPAGCVAVARFPDDNPLYPGWWLLGPLVRARHRWAGIGGELLHLALEEAAAERATWVYLLVSEDDTATLAFARKAGFLPASLPALQARLEEPDATGVRRIILSCALPVRRNRAGMAEDRSKPTIYGGDER